MTDELTELGISAAELARRINVPPNRISQILSGKRSVAADTALRLGKWFGTGLKIWLNLQQAYDLDVAQIEIGPELERIKPLEAAWGKGMDRFKIARNSASKRAGPVMP